MGYSAHIMSRIWRVFGSPSTRYRDSRRNFGAIRLLKNTRMANLQALYDPVVTGLSDETQYPHL
ncbi:hypothetical protein EMIT0P43_90223 [Pseudomonas jessenii]